MPNMNKGATGSQSQRLQFIGFCSWFMNGQCSAGCHGNILMECVHSAVGCVSAAERYLCGKKTIWKCSCQHFLDLCAQVFPSQNSSCLEFTWIPVEITIQYPCIPHVQPHLHTHVYTTADSKENGHLQKCHALFNDLIIWTNTSFSSIGNQTCFLSS